ncbi:MAG: hypothetical protein ACLSCV_04730 [Acutalibacteraceae bacterium]
MPEHLAIIMDGTAAGQKRFMLRSMGHRVGVKFKAITRYCSKLALNT